MRWKWRPSSHAGQTPPSVTSRPRISTSSSPTQPDPGPIHVTAPKAHRHEGVNAHRSLLKHHEIRERHNIPVASPVRTILDLAGCVSDDDLEAAVAEAFARRLTNRAALLRAIVPRRRGAARFRALLDAGPKRTRSAPERRLLVALRAAGVEEPETNAGVGRWEVDFYWPDRRLVIEVDGYAAHSSPAAFERDRRKDAELGEIGIEVRRFSANQVRDDLDRIVAWARRALNTT